MTERNRRARGTGVVLSLRVPQAVATAVDDAARRAGTSRSAWATALFERALASETKRETDGE